MPLRLEKATASHLDALFALINDAYRVENGSTGVAFKKDGELRFSSPEELRGFIAAGDVTIAVDDEASEIVGCMYAPVIIDNGVRRLSFGPLASLRRGAGSLLVREAHRIAAEQRCASIDISVINVRQDVFPWYLRQGFEVISEKPYPHPESCTRDVHFFVMRKNLAENDQE